MTPLIPNHKPAMKNGRKTIRLMILSEKSAYGI